MTVAEKLEAKGRKEGREEGRKEVASNLFKMGLSMADVSRATGLPIGALEQLRAQMG